MQISKFLQKCIRKSCRLLPYHKNSKKRLVKSPKIYLRDSGLLHAVARIKNERELKLHPLYGFSLEGYVIENLSVLKSLKPLK